MPYRALNATSVVFLCRDCTSYYLSNTAVLHLLALNSTAAARAIHQPGGLLRSHLDHQTYHISPPSFEPLHETTTLAQQRECPVFVSLFSLSGREHRLKCKRLQPTTTADGKFLQHQMRSTRSSVPSRACLDARRRRKRTLK